MKKVTSVYEAMNGLRRLRHDESRINKLKSYDSFALRTLLQGNFDPRVKFDFPKGEPPYEKKNEKVELVKPIVKRLGRCLANAPGTKVGKERMFIDFLEIINRRDAALFVLMKDRALQTKYPFLTEEIVRAAFPTLLPPKKDDSPSQDDSQSTETDQTE